MPGPSTSREPRLLTACQSRSCRRDRRPPARRAARAASTRASVLGPANSWTTCTTVGQLDHRRPGRGLSPDQRGQPRVAGHAAVPEQPPAVPADHVDVVHGRGDGHAGERQVLPAGVPPGQAAPAVIDHEHVETSPRRQGPKPPVGRNRRQPRPPGTRTTGTLGPSLRGRVRT